MSVIVLIIIMPFISADLAPRDGSSPAPGVPTREISVVHHITNINDYPDYIFFVTVGQSKYGPRVGRCPLEVIPDNGSVGYNHLNLCNLSIYAVKNTDYSVDQLNALNVSEVESLIKLDNVIELFKGLNFYDRVPRFSNISKEHVNHTIDAGILNKKENTNPDKNCPSIGIPNCPEGTDSENVLGDDGCIKNYKCTLYTGPDNKIKMDIKVMPETASQRAIERLGELGFNATLKSNSNKNGWRAYYELNGEKEGKMFGLFKVNGEVSAEVDAETGNVIKTHKPWWAFMASGI